VEICAVELETKLLKSVILTLYRVSTGNFNPFIQNLDDALKHLCNNKKDFFLWRHKHTISLKATKIND